MDCPECGAANAATAEFCTLCFKSFARMATRDDVAEDPTPLVTTAEVAEEYRTLLAEESEMWRKRRERMNGAAADEHDGAASSEVMPAAADPRQLAPARPVVEHLDVAASIAEATHRDEVLGAMAWGLGIFTVTALIAVAILATTDMASIANAAPQDLSGVADVAVSKLSPLFWRFIDALFVLFVGAAIAAGVVTRRTGVFRYGIACVAIVCAVAALLIVPYVLVAGSENPIISSLGFGLAFLFGGSLVGAMAGGGVGSFLSHRD